MKHCPQSNVTQVLHGHPATPVGVDSPVFLEVELSLCTAMVQHASLFLLHVLTAAFALILRGNTMFW
jgi:hypothetical protein